MWKFFSRGLRETFERGLNLSRNTDRVKQEVHTKPQCCWKYAPIALRNCYDRQKCAAKNERNEGTRERAEKTAPHNCDDWLGAFSYSSALVLGWVLTQPYYHWRKWWDIRNRPKAKEAIPLIPLLVKVAISQPVNTLSTKDFPSLKLCNDNAENSVTFGPVTAEEALEKAGEELQAVHNTVVGEIENRKGVDCIGKGENYKAVALFRSATDRGYAPAAYNLAQCYEMGIGTLQDFTKAAKWYKTAADWGHPTAMYNLGVFYAHGWGGLEASPDKARQLLSMAAARGQPEARAALGLEQPPTPPPSLVDEDKWNFSDLNSGSNSAQNITNNADELYNLGISYENSFEGHLTEPSLILEMYQMASDLGHTEAKSRLNILKAYDAVNLLTEYLMQKKIPWNSRSGRNIEGTQSVP